MSTFLMTRKAMASRYASLMRRQRDPKFKGNARFKAELGELSRWLKSGRTFQRAAKVFAAYEKELATKSAQDLSPTQARSTAIEIVASDYDLTPRQVRNIIKLFA